MDIFISRNFFSYKLTIYNFLVALMLSLLSITSASAATIYVTNTQEFTQALAAATPGTSILLRPGIYQGNLSRANLQGTANALIIIGASDPNNKPIIQGGFEGLKFSRPAYLEVRDLIFEGQGANAINMDDGGTYSTTPAHHIKMSGLVFRNQNGQNGIKISGVDNFKITNSQFIDAGYWDYIDMVGCHNGVIENSLFKSVNQVTRHSMQIKGGSADIIVRNNRIENVGQRSIQIGGNTGQPFFRPLGVNYEARNITVEHNVIYGPGTEGAVSFVGVDGANFRFNTVYLPRSWVMRILQETPGLIPTRNGVVTDNIFVYRSSEIRTTVNIGGGTEPQTFQFARNWWYNLDNPSSSSPSLPTPESAGTYGIDPLFVNAVGGDLHLRPESKAQKVGAYAGLLPTNSNTPSVSFVGADTITQGNWPDVYGAQGYNIIGGDVSLPSFATITPARHQFWMWASSTSDPRALIKNSTGDRVAACWYSYGLFTIDINLTDGQPHQVALYAVDLDSNNSHSQRIEVLNPVTGVALDKRTLSTFSNGVYLVWNLRGRVKILLTTLSGKAVVSGVFIDSATNVGPPDTFQ